MLHRPKNSQDAFSLVELSIVLVILGLLTGGILTGQNLIRAAELRSVTTEISSHLTATLTFREKYFYLPGDMPNATDFWGAVTAGGSCSTTTASTGSATCNGNGDGITNNAGAASQYGEVFTFWQHLVNAGLIEGNYTGRAGGSGSKHAIIGQNVPASKFPNGGWTVAKWAGLVGDGSNFTVDYASHFTFGAMNSTVDTSGVLLTPEEAWNIDTKLDDGMPARGRVYAIYWDTCTTATSNIDYSAKYLLSDSTKQCAFRIPIR